MAGAFGQEERVNFNNWGLRVTASQKEYTMNAVAVEKKFEIQVVYNGVTKAISVESHQQVNAVREKAIHEFRITQNPHLLSFFREDGSEIPDNQSVADAGIRPGELLALRPGAVKGG